MFRLSITLAFAVLVSAQSLFAGDSLQGSYRQAVIHGDTIVFVAEGDLWKVSTDGGTASRLTTHHGMESTSAVSRPGFVGSRWRFRPRPRIRLRDYLRTGGTGVSPVQTSRRANVAP